MDNEQNFESDQEQENLILIRVRILMQMADISDYIYEEQSDGIHFKIKTTPEHIEETRKQMATLGGGLKPTQFIKDKIIPLKNLLLQEQELKFNFIGNNIEAGYLEIVISRK